MIFKARWAIFLIFALQEILLLSTSTLTHMSAVFVAGVRKTSVSLCMKCKGFHFARSVLK
jgi:hypothetical protein